MTKTLMFVLMISIIKKYYLPISLILANIFIKSLYLVSEPISHDEPFTIYHAQFDVSALISYLKNYNNPPLFEFILHFWIKLFGISEISVRVLPMLFSSLSVFFIYKIGKEFMNESIALVASLLFTFSSMQIWYAHDCRVYSLFLLLTLVSFYMFFKLLKEGKLSLLNAVFLLFSNVLIMYAHYFGIFVWIVEGLIILLFYLKQKKVLITFSVLSFVAFIIYLPQITVLSQRFFDSAQNGTWLKKPEGIESIYNMIWSFTNAPVVAVLSIVVLFCSVVKFFVFSDRKIKNQFITYVIIWFIFPFVFMFFISYKIPMFLDRYLIFLTPAFYLLIALSSQYLFKDKRFSYSLMALFVFAFGFSFSFNPSKKRKIVETVDFIKSKKDEKTIVLVCSRDFSTSFAYYYNQEYFKQIDHMSEYAKLDELFNRDHVYFINRLDSNVIKKIDGFQKIIYLDAGADFSAPGNFIKRDLSNNYKLMEDKFFEELFYIYVYSTK